MRAAVRRPSGRRDASRSASQVRREIQRPAAPPCRSASSRLLGPDDRARACRSAAKSRTVPTGRKCSSARPLCSRSCATVVTIAGLIVIPAVRGNAGLFADLRARAVGADQQPRRQCDAVGESRHRRALPPASKRVDCAPARNSTPSCLAFATSASTSMPVLDHVRERLALLHLAAEGEECRTHRVVEL